ncbi:uncharacterized protein Z518_05821 [Rhinocladiella mackenziei CBS 650.93]|uniref:FAD-binding domain-containing protein n=1 Tax=Rhinocladiella mackenziei CBS 650.93 TaxID=1442369 RepID=A0A0D2J797_9EURO|nr:uncharacterized protein Z518_05821 [Rhinocladiella mackenziei CBS 650.93]KIX04950.1 hypothetical protein Z518_05821 [Rhinocladiella mackenziei CBS 650.93]
MTKPLALIAGAGIAGLSAAWWLDKAGWRSIVIERAPSIRVGGYVMTISGLGYETLKRMSLLDGLRAASQSFEHNVISDNYGKELCRIRYSDVHGGLESLAVRRDDLARSLADALPDTCSIRFEETISHATDEGDKIRAVLGGGDVIEANLLIGADGFRSKIREQFWKDGDSLEPLGYYYAAYNFGEEAETHNDCHSFNSPGHLDMLFALRDKGMTGMHIWREERNLLENRQNKFDILREITTGGVPQVCNAIDRAEKANVSPVMDSLNLVTLPRWSQGRVLLLGDAAHCLTLLSGQGAGMAIVSAEILGRELMKTTNISQALLNHETKLRPSIERLQTRTRTMAGFYIPKTVFSYRLRNLLLKLMPYSWIVSYHVNTLKAEIDLT